MTLPALLIQQLRRYPEQKWLSVPDISEHDITWTSYTRSEIEKLISGMVVRLYALGVGEGTKVAICANSCAEWLLLDLAVLTLRGTVVGIYPTLPAEDIVYQLNDSEAEFLFLQDDSMHERLSDSIDELETVYHLFSLSESQKLPQIMPAEPDVELFERLAAQVQASDVATLIYTSGTTGAAKGVMLKQAQLLSALNASSSVFPLYRGDRSIIYLPMAHILQRFVVYRALIDDVEGAISPSFEALPKVIRSIRPHVLVVVPRVLEKILEQGEREAQEKGELPRLVFRWAMKVAQQWSNAENRRSRRLTIQHRLANRLVFSKIRAGLGGHLRCILSGAAPLSPTLAATYLGMGIAVVEGWGLSESCGPATMVHPQDYRIGSVGKALSSIAVRTSPQGELQLKGESLFEAYWNKAEATAKAFTKDGWFKTGDIGEIDSEGYVWITGRIKDLIVTAGGKNIAPQPIELQLSLSGIAQTIVIGDRRPYLIALFAPDELSTDVPTAAAIEQQVAMVNQALPSFAQIKRWAILPGPLHPEEGLLTPTLKPKRAAIMSTYAALIESIYAESR